MELSSKDIAKTKRVVRHPFKHAEKALAHQRPDGVLGEWVTVLPEKRKRLQNIAHSTHGIVTVGNAISVTGGLISANGLRHYNNGDYKKAVIYTFIGRVLDLADGAAAAYTETRGAPGAFIDSVIDKSLCGAYIAISVKTGRMSIAEAAVHGGQQLGSAVENTRLKFAGGEPNPNNYGKSGQLALWLMAGGDMSSAAADQMELPNVNQSLEFGTNGLKMAAIALNGLAAYDYRQERIAFE